MKSKKGFLPKIPFFLTLILSFALILGWQVTVDAATVKFGDNSGDDFPGTVEDALIWERDGYTVFNYGAKETIPVGENSTLEGEHRSLIRFQDIASSIGYGNRIISATLHLYCTSEDSIINYSVSAYRVLLNWVEGSKNGATEDGSSCWNYAQYNAIPYNAIPWNTVGCDEADDITGEDSTADRKATAEDSTTITGTGTYFSWDLTNAVRKWYSGEWSEYGVILIHDSPDTTDSRKHFASRDYATDGHRPYLEVTYCSPEAGSTLEVCKTGGCTYDKIQDAINIAVTCDTVKVIDDDTYDELVRMKNGVDVVSAPNKAHITRSSGSGKEEVVGFSGAMTCDLKGFEISNSVGGAGIFMDGSGSGIVATIENSDIHDCKSAAGIRLNGVISATIIGCNIYSNEWAGIATSKNQKDKLVYDSSVTIEDNLIYQNGTKSDGTAGIFLKGDSGNTVDVVIRGTGEVSKKSHIYDNPQAGIRLEDIYDAVTIDNNEVNNNSKAGICIIDVGSGTTTATIQNNDIHHNTKAGITVAGDSYLTIGSDNLIRENDFAGVAFRKASIDVFQDPINVSSQPVSITGNNIYSNTYAGIGIIDAITVPVNETVTITQNDIYQNIRAGIGIQNSCTLEISKNTIRNNTRGGIHTGTDVADTGGFSGTAGSAVLTIGQNKVYGNGDSGYGAGIDVRHASGTIYNNLVYRNHRGGIRFGDWITEIVNNTVVHNGNDNNTPADPTDDIGGGIIYDDINAGDAVNDPPEGTLADSPNYPNPRIRNNISAYNVLAGLRVGNKPTGLTACPDNPFHADTVQYRDYNLLYSNHLWNNVQSRWNDPDCGYPDSLDVSCTNQQYGGCGIDSDLWPPVKELESKNDIMADPLFVSITEGSEDYHLQSTEDGYPQNSPAIDAGAWVYDDDVSLPPGEGTSWTDMGAYGGPLGINW